MNQKLPAVADQAVVANLHVAPGDGGHLSYEVWLCNGMMYATQSGDYPLVFAASSLESMAPAPLTHEQIDSAFAAARKNGKHLTAYEAARAIEAAHGIGTATAGANSPAAVQFWTLESAARALEAAAEGFCEIAAPGDATASGLADSYGMAANEIRLQIPAYAAMKERNLALIKAWDKASVPPELERWDPNKYAPGTAP